MNEQLKSWGDAPTNASNEVSERYFTKLKLITIMEAENFTIEIKTRTQANSKEEACGFVEEHARKMLSETNWHNAVFTSVEARVETP